MKLLIIFTLLLCCSCTATQFVKKEIKHQYKSFPYAKEIINIDSLVDVLNPLSAREREKKIIPLMLAGNIPAFDLNLKKIKLHFTDSSGKKYKAIIFVSPDYLSIGSNTNYMHMPLTPQAAQRIADSLHCILPTKKMVDLIYENASIKTESYPLTEKRDSLKTFLQHDRIIQEQLNLNHNKGIIAGTKKDVVQTPGIYTASKPNRVAIYGWHKLNGKAIQPLYTGHIDWYVDYSHGIRLVYEKMIVNGKILFIKDVLNDPVLSKLICDEAICRYTRYKE
jgi:hypothetical protein